MPFPFFSSRSSFAYELLPIAIKTKPQSYDIIIGKDVLDQAGALLQERLGARRCLIVTDENVAPHYLTRLENALKNARHELESSITIPAGEKMKSLPGIHELMHHIFDRIPDRNLVILALGGGVIGDLTGYAAAITLRGLDLVQVPTTLLAQVDSSVGGKNGINSLYGKNTVGTFYQPRLVLSDVTTLQTLPERERKAGYAETVKYALIKDRDFFAWCQENGEKIIKGDAVACTYAINKCCAHKAKIVGEDERESGVRALLNLGHTFGHAQERAVGYEEGNLLHGEAVIIGTLMAFDLSARLGLCPREDAETVRTHFETLGYRLTFDRTKHDVDDLIQFMRQDKKASDGKLTLILAKGIGQAFVARDVNPGPLQALWQDYLA